MPKSEESSRWIKAFHADTEYFAYIACFPHAGGSASYFFDLSRALQPDVGVLAIQYPGRQDRLREPCAEAIGALADGAFEALRQREDLPLALFGHSMGAVVAYEVARRFARSSGRPPPLLMVSSRLEPGRHWNRNVHLLDDAGLTRELRRIAGADQSWLNNEKLLAMALPAVRSDYRAIESYHWMPGPPLDCSIMTLVGDQDPYVEVEEMAGWENYCTGDFGRVVLPGGHFYLETHSTKVTGIVLDALTRTFRSLQ